jgi:hypothetical protein
LDTKKFGHRPRNSARNFMSETDAEVFLPSFFLQHAGNAAGLKGKEDSRCFLV